MRLRSYLPHAPPTGRPLPYRCLHLHLNGVLRPFEHTRRRGGIGEGYSACLSLGHLRPKARTTSGSALLAIRNAGRTRTWASCHRVPGHARRSPRGTSRRSAREGPSREIATPALRSPCAVSAGSVSAGTTSLRVRARTWGARAHGGVARHPPAMPTVYPHAWHPGRGRQ